MRRTLASLLPRPVRQFLGLPAPRPRTVATQELRGDRVVLALAVGRRRLEAEFSGAEWLEFLRAGQVLAVIAAGGWGQRREAGG